ncbi:hypothetical protein OV450_7279 [Actinobacteria bacterium OV450]|nr:hypothetical protein OV450_7279 [Actinobacteria bacterium OV450]
MTVERSRVAAQIRLPVRKPQRGLRVRRFEGELGPIAWDLFAGVVSECLSVGGTGEVRIRTCGGGET